MFELECWSLTASLTCGLEPMRFWASPLSQGEFDELWCFIKLLTFVLERLEFVAPFRCNSASPTCLLGSFTTGLGKYKSTACSLNVTDEVLDFFSAITFGFERSRVTVPSWHGLALSDQWECGRSTDCGSVEGAATWGPQGES
jgi:hypothetical protein